MSTLSYDCIVCMMRQFGKQKRITTYLLIADCLRGTLGRHEMTQNETLFDCKQLPIFGVLIMMAGKLVYYFFCKHSIVKRSFSRGERLFFVRLAVRYFFPICNSQVHFITLIERSLPNRGQWA